ncbi:MAG: DUF423 domain-containing protein [bacterium]|nr:DUF423 domain-containing protein [bacterium]
MRRWMVLAAGVLGCLGVMIGAYGAHGLEASLTDQQLSVEDVQKRLEQCDIAVRYHMLHVLAILCLGIVASDLAVRLRTLAVVFFLLGILLFCGGLYAMVFLGVMGHWAIVPSGGLCFMLGWLCVALIAISKQPPSEK